MTLNQFIKLLQEKNLTYTDIEQIGNNRFRVEYDNGFGIWFYQTEVLRYDGDKMTLNTDGWKTRTSKSVMNKFLPEGTYIENKGKDNWIVYSGNDCKPYEDMMEIPVAA